MVGERFKYDENAKHHKEVIMMTRIYIRRYKRNPDFWEVCGPGKNVQVRTKREAQSIAAARRRVREKRANRR